MNISLTPTLEKMVHTKVKSGLYHSASEVIREGLRLLKDQDTLKAHRLKELQKEIALGIKQADAGQLDVLDMKAIKAEGQKRLGRKTSS